MLGVGDLAQWQEVLLGGRRSCSAGGLLGVGVGDLARQCSPWERGLLGGRSCLVGGLRFCSYCLAGVIARRGSGRFCSAGLLGGRDFRSVCSWH